MKNKETIFWTRVKKTNSCWNWTGCLTSKGYGQFTAFGQCRSHRVSWVIHNGQIPAGKCVLHTCDNRKCIRPDHLYIGTEKDNARDAVIRGRHAKAKLTPEQVLSIRSEYDPSEHHKRRAANNIASIARRRKLSFSAVQQIVNGITWKAVINGNR